MSELGWLLLAGALVLCARRVDHRARHGRPRPPVGRRRPPLPWLAGGLLAVVVVIVGGRLGAAGALPVAIATGVLVRRLERRARPAGPDPRSAALLLNLLASALSVGAPPEQALGAVARAVDEYGTAALRRAVEPLRLVGGLLRLGTDPTQAWAVLDAVPELAPVAAAGRRCAHSGARLAGALSEVATELRARHRAASVARAERTGVWALLPLGCCFLPAFVCVGVVPVVLGVAGQALAG